MAKVIFFGKLDRTRSFRYACLRSGYSTSGNRSWLSVAMRCIEASYYLYKKCYEKISLLLRFGAFHVHVLC
jgi:hypothetical protein